MFGEQLQAERRRDVFGGECPLISWKQTLAQRERVRHIPARRSFASSCLPPTPPARAKPRRAPSAPDRNSCTETADPLARCSARAMVTLKAFPVTSLVADRIVERRSCAERPHRFEYALTRHVTAVLPVLDTWHDLGQRMKAARAAE